jgi:hypothetical protein
VAVLAVVGFEAFHDTAETFGPVAGSKLLAVESDTADDEFVDGAVHRVLHIPK